MQKSENYEMFYYEGISFLIASWAIYKKFENAILENPEMSQDYYIGVYWASHVNHAYALEMFLKSLSIIDNGEYIFGHKLKEIFLNLRQQTQDEVLNESNMNRDQFITTLNEFDEPFKRYRYWAEKAERLPEYKLDGHADSIMRYIKKLKPHLPDTF